MIIKENRKLNKEEEAKLVESILEASKRNSIDNSIKSMSIEEILEIIDDYRKTR